MRSLLFLPFTSISSVYRTRKAFFLIGAILFTSSGIPCPSFAQEPELVADENKDFVYETLPYSLDFVRSHINLQFDSNDRAFYEDYNGAIYQLPANAKTIHDLSPQAYKKFIAFPLVKKSKFYVFFGAYKNMQHALQEVTPYSTVGLNNPALQRYALLPAEARSNDIYLWSPDTPFWHSEYSTDNVPTPFRSYFIIHLTAIDQNKTTVEIIEQNPVLSLGRKLSVDAHGVIQHFAIKDATPTTADRVYLLSCINQFIDRKLPGRHWFSCKTDAELEEMRKKAEEQKRQ